MSSNGAKDLSGLIGGFNWNCLHPRNSNLAPSANSQAEATAHIFLLFESRSVCSLSSVTMPGPSSSGSSGAPSLRKPASTTFLHSNSQFYSPTSPSNGPASSTAGWRSIFRMPSTRKLNIRAATMPVPANEGDILQINGSSATSEDADQPSSNSYASSQSSESAETTGSQLHTQVPKLPYPSKKDRLPLQITPTLASPPSPSAVSPVTPSSHNQHQPRKQKSGFLSRKTSSAKLSIQQTPNTAQSQQQTFNVASPRNGQSSSNNNVNGGTTENQSPNTKSVTKFLRRVASAPNAKGLFRSTSNAHLNSGLSKNHGYLSPGVPPLPNASMTDLSGPGGSLETLSSQSSIGKAAGLSGIGKKGGRANRALTVSSVPRLSPVGNTTDVNPPRAPFRRTYSSNSMKHRAIEVRPSSFQKLKMLGRGDVGKVYLVREKKTDKLFAMKGH